MFCQIFVRRELAVFNSREAKYIIDAGANIGLTSVFLANRCPNAKIDALEGGAGQFARDATELRAPPEYPGGGQGALAWCGAYQDRQPSAESRAFFVHETTEDDPAAIAAVGVLQLMEQRKQAAIDFLKVDIEGSEVELSAAATSPGWMP